MAIKNIKRLKRAKKSRSKIELSEKNRLTVFRSNTHIYAQILNFDGSQVIVSASTTEASLKSGNNGNIEAASKVGKLIFSFERAFISHSGREFNSSSSVNRSGIQSKESS